MAVREGDFASLLDDLFEKVQPPVPVSPVTSQAMDALHVADELYSGRIKVSAAIAENRYRETTTELETPVEAIEQPVDDISEFIQNEILVEVEIEQEPETVEPDAIAAELGLRRAFWQTRLKPDDFDRIRREFAMHNHPDRVAPHLRQRALVRMQIANMLIDEAKRRKP